MFQKYEDLPTCLCTEPIQELYSFRDLMPEFISGTPIKRKHWGGYWVFDANLNNIKIFTKEGEVLLFTDTDNTLYTISHMIMHDWVIARNENCDIEVK